MLDPRETIDEKPKTPLANPENISVSNSYSHRWAETAGRSIEATGIEPSRIHA